MTKYIALLRAVNVGGTGRLAMADLKSLCAHAGFDRIETYIASGNVVFESGESASRVQSELESRLCDHARRPIQVFIRTALELQEILAGNPFPKAEPRSTYVFFLGAARRLMRRRTFCIGWMRSSAQAGGKYTSAILWGWANPNL